VQKIVSVFYESRYDFEIMTSEKKYPEWFEKMENKFFTN